jgi:hypothetical protein
MTHLAAGFTHLSALIDKARTDNAFASAVLFRYAEQWKRAGRSQLTRPYGCFSLLQF